MPAAAIHHRLLGFEDRYVEPLRRRSTRALRNLDCNILLPPPVCGPSNNRNGGHRCRSCRRDDAQSYLPSCRRWSLIKSLSRRGLPASFWQQKTPSRLSFSITYHLEHFSYCVCAVVQTSIPWFMTCFQSAVQFLIRSLFSLSNLSRYRHGIFTSLCPLRKLLQQVLLLWPNSWDTKAYVRLTSAALTGAA